MQLLHSQTPANTAGEALTNSLRAGAEHPILLLLSGGSALALLDHVDSAVLGPHVTISTLDERIAIDPTINNFAQITATNFYQRACDTGVEIISTLVQNSDILQQVGERFEQSLRQWRLNNPDGIVIATMGVGVDGHTAGIFTANHDGDVDSHNWVAAYTLQPGTHQYVERVTVTNTFLREQVTHAIVYITGVEKQPVLNRLQQSDCQIAHTPACILQQMQSVVIVTDQSVTNQ